ncbi:HpcH/HpaI aldolase family protein [Psychromarinibacter halotolerans]|uniref:HpcH/HpaI aldolase/citrate lyase family protein n=1 Tax=Psychromarinibacter halotolerans TaxID=1775175 RepID=A0ABV7GQS4_9RHOB|nr:aldolase/citrate lyase family protein [Psychromarinibacter halotolerans]MAQ82353.1 4-hydroxy-2-oxo-heptane-1,7-dioate aldolase [Maritimibacter sp.]MAQ83808.1 4-hydroxy-2-oxo-heptane-1,7-dioate aldolase [Maritimibacter sp.]MDF0598930.1 aldolase/citrate lyase family protein [Psychromarinibacter halotolerans]
MEFPKNRFKEAILAGTPQVGIWCSIPDPAMAEMLANTGYDWMMFDTEHSPMDPLNVQPMLQAAAPYDVSCAVRPTGLDPLQIKKFLDAGAQTVMIPYIQTPEEAALAVAAVTYPPDGMRGVAGVMRASRWGAVADYGKKARDEICLIVQIETKEAVDRLEEIAAVPGVDAIFVGPADMAASLGYIGQNGHPEVRRACADAIRRIRAAGKPAGFLSPDDSLLEEMVDAGSVFTAVDLDVTILRRGALARAKAWQDRLKS